MVLAGIKERARAFPSCRYTTFTSVYSERVLKLALRDEKNIAKVQSISAVLVCLCFLLFF